MTKPLQMGGININLYADRRQPMNKNLHILFILLIGGIGVQTFTSCSSDNGNDDTTSTALEGIWVANDGRTIIFTGNTFDYKVSGITQASGTFSISGSTITFNRTDSKMISGDFQLSGETLTIWTGDRRADGTYTKISCGGGSSVGCLATPTKTEFVDNRNNKTYKKVKIGTQTWMAENLNYEIEGSKCYGEGAPVVIDGNTTNTKTLSEKEVQDNCTKYGRLYDWSTAMGLPSSCNSTADCQIQSKHRGICPPDWHIPSKADWEVMMAYIGGAITDGKKLETTSGWNSNNGTDDYGFSALPGGNGCPARSFYCSYFGLSDGAFLGLGGNGNWWSTSGSYEDGDEDAAYALVIANSNEYEVVITTGVFKSALLSVRCLQD